ncbi:MAG TPA: Gfo/Idh/MocA family oxidoreductase [Bryobacteraceae bacterium]|nr:Gfo/Idh/MocA family oxidoreductase [Bryobacteraceae bacterium]
MKPLTLFLALTTLTAADLRLGFIGTDTSHVTAFTKILNDPASPDHIPGARIVAAYKGGSPDLDESRTRIDRFTKELQDKWQIKIVDTIPDLLQQVDAVLITSVDGRVHLGQARAAIAAHKPLFIDKPLASTLEDAREIARLAKEAGVPWFSASSLRFSGIAKMRTPDLAGAITWGPGPLEEHHHLDLAWYAIHPIEMLYTLMGPGCEEVTRISTSDSDVIVGRWKDGRIGTVRAMRPYADYGAIAFHKNPKAQSSEVATKVDSGYAPLVREIVQFFQSGRPPVANEETLEIFAFLDAAQRSKESGGRPVRIGNP